MKLFLENFFKMLHYLRKYNGWNNPSRTLSLYSTIDIFSTMRRKVFVIQVGANDGKTYDPLYKFMGKSHWKGVLLEPQKQVFEKGLQETYKHYSNLQLINAAIAPFSGKKKLFKIAFSTANWATGLSSFDQATMLNLIQDGYVATCASAEGVALPERIEDFFTTEEVACVSFGDLMDRCKIETVDVLAIDTEGYDFEVIKMFNFERTKPDLILYENIHLNLQDAEACTHLLQGHGYKIFKKDANTVALRRSLANAFQLQLMGE